MEVLIQQIDPMGTGRVTFSMFRAGIETFLTSRESHTLPHTLHDGGLLFISLPSFHSLSLSSFSLSPLTPSFPSHLSLSPSSLSLLPSLPPFPTSQGVPEVAPPAKVPPTLILHHLQRRFVHTCNIIYNLRTRDTMGPTNFSLVERPSLSQRVPYRRFHCSIMQAITLLVVYRGIDNNFGPWTFFSQCHSIYKLRLE